MTTKQALEILRAHNEWRRDRSEIPAPQPWYTAKELGQALDVAIETLQRFEGAVEVDVVDIVDSFEFSKSEIIKTLHTIEVCTDDYSYDFFDKHTLYAIPKESK